MQVSIQVGPPATFPLCFPKSARVQPMSWMDLLTFWTNSWVRNFLSEVSGWPTLINFKRTNLESDVMSDRIYSASSPSLSKNSNQHCQPSWLTLIILRTLFTCGSSNAVWWQLEHLIRWLQVPVLRGTGKVHSSIHLSEGPPQGSLWWGIFVGFYLRL